MTSESSLEDIEKTRKRLIFRSWHRGTREMDLILGSFADRHVPDFNSEDLASYQDILCHSDPDLYNWITGKDQVPANFMSPVMERLLRHNPANN